MYLYLYLYLYFFYLFTSTGYFSSILWGHLSPHQSVDSTLSRQWHDDIMMMVVVVKRTEHGWWQCQYFSMVETMTIMTMMTTLPLMTSVKIYNQKTVAVVNDSAMDYHDLTDSRWHWQKQEQWSSHVGKPHLPSFPGESTRLNVGGCLLPKRASTRCSRPNTLCTLCLWKENNIQPNPWVANMSSP